MSLIERLACDDPRPIVSVVAPAGYGKTTLLSQWAERNGQPFAWVSVEEEDNDPKALLTCVAEALDTVEPLDKRVFDALASPASSVPGSVVPRLGSALASMSSPVVLVLDDVHVLHNPECRAAVSVLADQVRDDSRLVLAGRGEPPLRVARLRAEGRILEIGPGDLSLTRGEVSLLLRDVGVALGEDEVAELHRRTEGWPAAIYLAALHWRKSASSARAVASLGGGHRLVTHYLESEFLSQLSPHQREFLTRISVLKRMSGPLCDAVLGQPASAATLAELAQSNLMLVPLDRRGEWYRYHHLFREMLLNELRRRSPDLIPVLRRRAIEWCLRNGLLEEALEYSRAAGDVNTVAGLVERLAVLAYRQGRIATVQRWFRWLQDRGGIEGHPLAAALASMLSALTGRPVDAERWADAVDQWQYGDMTGPGNPSAAAWAALVRAILCRRGVERMRADADEAARSFTELSAVDPAATLMRGLARVLTGDLHGGDAALEDAASIAETTDAHDDHAVALCERALVAIARGEWDRAGIFAEDARTTLRVAGIEESYATPLVCAVHARITLRGGNVSAVRQELVSAQRLRPVLTYALPHLAVQARIELARVNLALGDLAGARVLMREIDDLLRRRPGLGTLADEAGQLRAQLSRERTSGVLGASSLTAAELRLLPLLSTHLSFREIAEELSLSRNTIKAEVNSIYRKLGTSTRSQAVSRSRDLGLLDT